MARFNLDALVMLPTETIRNLNLQILSSSGPLKLIPDLFVNDGVFPHFCPHDIPIFTISIYPFKHIRVHYGTRTYWNIPSCPHEIRIFFSSELSSQEFLELVKETCDDYAEINERRTTTGWEVVFLLSWTSMKHGCHEW